MINIYVTNWSKSHGWWRVIWIWHVCASHLVIINEKQLKRSWHVKILSIVSIWVITYAHANGLYFECDQKEPIVMRAGKWHTNSGFYSFRHFTSTNQPIMLIPNTSQISIQRILCQNNWASRLLWRMSPKLMISFHGHYRTWRKLSDLYDVISVIKTICKLLKTCDQ